MEFLKKFVFFNAFLLWKKQCSENSPQFGRKSRPINHVIKNVSDWHATCRAPFTNVNKFFFLKKMNKSLGKGKCSLRLRYNTFGSINKRLVNAFRGFYKSSINKELKN